MKSAGRVGFEMAYEIAGMTINERLEGQLVDTVIATNEAVVRLDDGNELCVDWKKVWFV